MNTIKTTAPIAIDELKKYFADDTIIFEIDYANSSLKGNKFLIYLSNLNIPCDIDVKINDEFLELLKDYFNAKTLVSIRSLEIAALDMLFSNRFKYDKAEHSFFSNEQTKKFIDENKEILDCWSKKLDSLTIYNMQTIDAPEFKEFVESFPTDDTDDLTGINFVQLLKYEEFYAFYSNINNEWLTNYTAYFNNYMFKGKNLYSFWATVNNPMHVLTTTIANGDITGEDFANAYAIEKETQQSL
jgi:hypothetical protein